MIPTPAGRRPLTPIQPSDSAFPGIRARCGNGQERTAGRLPTACATYDSVMFEVPFEATRFHTWWPWIALSFAVVVIAVGGALFSAI